MPSIKCPSCGQRIIHSNVLNFCTNCGAFLPSSPAEPQPAQPATPSSTQTDMPPTLPDPPAEDRALVPRQQRLPDHAAAQSTSLVSRASSSSLPSPYQSVTDDLSYDPFSHSRQTVVTEVPDAPLPFSWEKDRLPWGFPRRSPDLTGTLIHVQTQMETQRSYEVLGALLKMLLDMLWAIAGDSSSASKRVDEERDKVQITTLRIRTSSGAQKDARLQGYLTGANLTLGDRISLWGWKRRGALLVRKGYNHTSKSTISIRGMTSPISILLLFTILAIALYVLTYWYHIPLIPTLSR